MAKNVPVVAILMIVQGVLEMLMGLLYVLIGPMLFGFLSLAGPPPSSSAGGPTPAETMGIMSAVYIAMGLPALIAGVLKVVAAIKNLKYRGRTLGIVALASGAVTVVTCYCMPTAIALMVFGLIVYLNEESVRAFAMGEEGRSPEEIKAELLKVPGHMPPGAPNRFG